MFYNPLPQQLTFGQALKKLRYEMRYRDNKIFSQQELADDVGYNVKMIRSLENDEKEELNYNLILKIAEVFQLTEQQKRDFFALAGLMYYPKFDHFSKEELKSTIENLLRGVTYPSQVITPTWDILAFNKYIYHLYEYNSEKISIMKNEPFGTNLLKLLFDKRFEMKKFFGHNWKPQMIRNVKAFRALSLRYITSDVYHNLISMMFRNEKRYEGITDIWHSSFEKNLVSAKNEIIVEPSTTVIINQNPLKKIKFWTLRFPQEYIGSEAIILGHIPADSKSEEIFSDFRENLPLSLYDIYHFDIPDYSDAKLYAKSSSDDVS